MDELLLPFMLQAFLILFDCVGTIINIIIVNPWMIILTAIAGFVFYVVTVYYLITAQDAKRLEGTSKNVLNIYRQILCIFIVKSCM